jgi:hypothetical protein
VRVPKELHNIEINPPDQHHKNYVITCSFGDLLRSGASRFDAMEVAYGHFSEVFTRVKEEERVVGVAMPEESEGFREFLKEMIKKPLDGGSSV